MNHNKLGLSGLLLIALCTYSVFNAKVNAEVVYQDNFDAITIESIPYYPRRGQLPDGDWLTIYNNLARAKTEVIAGSGALTILTADRNSGVISREPLDDFDFFKRELTYTFDGISIQALGASRISSQWVKFGVVSRTDRQLWGAFPYFLVTYSGAGGFSLLAQQQLTNGVKGYDRVARKLFRSKVFNFEVSKLQKVQLTMDSVNFRVRFIFENILDQLTFGGPHNMNRDLWFADTVGLTSSKSRLDSAAKTLASYELQLETAQSNGDAAAEINTQKKIDTWQAIYDENLIVYDEKLIAAETIKGDSALLIAVTSDAMSVIAAKTATENVLDDDGNIGARVVVNSVTVETTNILEGL